MPIACSVANFFPDPDNVVILNEKYAMASILRLSRPVIHRIPIEEQERPVQ
jgi:hypothetical protein